MATTTQEPGQPPQAAASLSDLVTPLLTHLTDVAVLVVDRELRYVGAGGAGLQAAGWETAELLGRTVHELVPSEEAAVLADRYQRALDGEVVQFAHRGERSPDRLHDVEIVPIRGADGTIGSALIVSRDITEPVAAATTLAERDERLQALTGSSGDMLALYDLDGVYLEVSAAATTLFGWASDELVGTSSYDYFHPDDLALISETHADVLETDQVGPIEYRLRCKDGSYRWVEVIGRNLHDPDTGELTSIQCTTRDIQRRHEAEAALRDSEARFRTAMASAPIGQSLLGIDGTIQEVNTALCDMLGTDRDALLGQPARTLLEPLDHDRYLAAFGRLLAGMPRATLRAGQLRGAQAAATTADLHLAMVRDPSGAPLHVLLQVVDLSELHEAQEDLNRLNAQLQRKNGELQRFAAAASHDLRAPLGNAIGLLELLEQSDGRGDEAAARDLVDRVRRQLARMLDTVDGLLALSDVGVDPLNITEMAVAELLAEVDEDLAGLPERQRSIVILTEDAAVTGDRRLLRSLLQNLLANALRSSEEARAIHVEVSARRDATTWTLEVTDDGDGIEVALRDKLFEPFARRQGLGQPHGHGLGLPTCLRIVERHGGQLRVEHLDPGTRFTVVVPHTTQEHGTNDT